MMPVQSKATSIFLSATLMASGMIYPNAMIVQADEGNGLSTAYTGDEILDYAKATYDDWSYQDADTCTGFMSHVFYEDLKVPVGMDIIGRRVFVGYGWEPYNGYLTDYNPDEMIAVAEKMVAEGKAIKVFDGLTKDSYNSAIPIRNGDIVLTSAGEMGAQYGHVAMAEVREEDGTIGWFGAHGPIGTHDQEVSYMAFSKTDSETKYTTGTPKDAPMTYEGMIHVYRVVDFEKPDYKTDVDTSKEITYSLALKETTKDTDEPVEGTQFKFRSGEDEEDIKTDKQGIARKSIIQRFDVNPADYTYITNYEKLSKADKEEADKRGVFHSYEEAQAKADEDLMKKAVASPVDFSNYTVTETNTGKELTLKNPKAETDSTKMELVVEDARLTKQSVRIVGLSVGAKCAIYDSDEKLVEEFLTKDLGQGTAGYIAKNLTQNATYKIREIQEPQGYVKSKDVTVTVGAGDNTAFLQEQPIMATLKVSATGQVFEKFESGEPVYREEGIDKVTYTVFAKEDIITGTKIVYTHGQEVGTFQGEIKNLPVGHYYFVVSDAPQGYALDGKRYDFAVENGTTADPVYEMDVDLNTQQVTLSIGDLPDTEEVSVYNKESNEKLYTSKVDENGVITASKTTNLPVGKYYLTRKEDPKKPYEFEVKGISSSISSYVKPVYKSTTVGSITVQLKDASKDEKPIKNTEFIVSESENFEKILQEEKTNKDGVLTFKNLKKGTYYVRQSGKTGNYALQDKTYQVVLGDESMDVTITPKNRSTELIITSKDLGGVLSVEGVGYALKDEHNKVIDKWESTKMAHIITGLEEGKNYKVVATNVAEGYDKPADVDFVMSDGLTVTMKSKELEEFGLVVNSLFETWQLLLATIVTLPPVIWIRNKIRKRKGQRIYEANKN